MIVTLHRDSWDACLPALEGMPRVIDRIIAALNEQPGALVEVEGRVEGWRAVAGRLEQEPRTYAIGRTVRLMCCAVEAELW